MESEAGLGSVTYRAAPVFKPDAQRGAVVGETALIMGGHAAHSDDDAGQEEILLNRRRSFSALVRRKSKAPVSSEELTSVREYVMHEVALSKQDILAKLSNATTMLQGEVDTLRDSVASQMAAAEAARKATADEAQRFTVECSTQLQNELHMVRYSIEERMQRGFEATEQHLHEMRAHELLAHDRLEQIINIVQAKLAATTAVRWASSVALLDQHRREVHRWVEELRESTDAKFEAALSKAAGDATELRALQRDGDEQQREALKSQHADLKARIDQTAGLIEGFATTMERKRVATEDGLRTTVDSFKADAERRIQAIEVEARRLFKVVSEVENIPTRRVEWHIKAASVRLALNGERSWLSPKFEAAGAHGLQLELRTLPETTPEGEGAAGTPEGDAQVQGDCAVQLHAADSGLRLVCKLFVGTASVQLQHTFDGNTPCSTRRMNCLLKDQINPEDDTLQVGIEILEAVRAVRNVQRPPSAGTRSQVRTGELLEGPLICHRHLNHRTLELVQDQVDLMRSRMVRRIEWRLEQASSLRRLFAEGECACSAPFEAAGMSGMQLIFYPSGYTGVREGYCSFFLHCGGGTSLRCWLWAGKQKREARVSFEHAGLLGRTNFCRYENCIDHADDTILLVLEIEEAQQDTTESMWHAPSCAATATAAAAASRRSPSLDGHTRPSRPPSSILSVSPAAFGATSGGTGGTGGRETDARATPPPAPIVDRIDSSMKLRRTPGKIALEDVKQLPSIWTTRPQANVSEALEGYYNFSDVRNVMKKPPLSARPSSTRPSTREGGGLGGAAAATQALAQPVAPRYMMYAT